MKDRFIKFRVDENEDKAFRLCAEYLNISLSEFVRTAVLEKFREVTKDIPEVEDDI